MGGRFLDRLFARFGYGLIPLKIQEEERQGAARTIEALERNLARSNDDRGALQGEIGQLKQSHDKRQALLQAELAAACAAAAEQARQSARAQAAEAAAHAEGQARLWGKLSAIRAALEASRAASRQASEALLQQAQSFAERSAAEAEAQAATLTDFWARLEREKARSAAARAAEIAQGERLGELQQALRETKGQISWYAGKLETESERRSQTAARLAVLERKLAAARDRTDMARDRQKLEIERSTVKKLQQKLRSEHKRTLRLAAEIEAAKIDARAQRLEAERARGEEQRLIAKIALADPGGSMGAGSGDHADAAVAWLAQARGGRRSAKLVAEEHFRQGQAFQIQGEIGLAAACYRRVGPHLTALLAQEGPDGDQISGPDFLIIGAARAGTTWLKKCLAHHPQVFILSGEHHYFSTSSHLPPESYVGRFANAHTRFQRPGQKVKQFARPSERLYAEKSTTYLAMPQAQIDLCAALFPRAKLICMVRDPVARVWSHLKHLKFNDALRSLDNLSQLPPWATIDELIRQGRYEEHLVRWARRFDPDQMLLVDFARLASEPDAVHAEILAHIGAQPAPAPQELDEVSSTERVAMPADFARRLRAAFELERFDIPYLRQAMEQAAAAQRTSPPETGPVRKRSVRLAG